MRALYKAPTDAKFHQLNIPNDLHTMQELVGGYIEALTVKENSHEEATKRGLESFFMRLLSNLSLSRKNRLNQKLERWRAKC